jgi:AraC-like DNA-binding protein
MTPQPILPDGTTELIVHRGRPFRHFSDDRAELQASRLFVGQLTKPAIIAPDGDADVVAIRFRPFGAFALTGIPPGLLTDHIADATSLGCRWLTDAMREAKDADTAIDALRALEAALVRRVTDARGAPAVDNALVAAVQAIDLSRGTIRIDDVATTAGVTRRHLERLFDTRVGLTPKSYARLIRLQTAASRLAATPDDRLADVSGETGYFDESHMIREFLAIAGRSPAEFRTRLSVLTRTMLARQP